MKDVAYYRERAAQARRLARSVHQRDLHQTLRDMAQGYEDIAEDLENGAVEIRHPELMPQREHRTLPTSRRTPGASAPSPNGTGEWCDG
jgi:hypothetical protein